ncbi:hypothetical protein PIB30_061942 [Stylosanthes scabra]|uniref:Uncharacterized protein n=1 Tax=Stylosanthes scabra TaxID=79078 RepID=A0ABU6WLQ0_9FABA|nr:hypothetical protein [Stylosanthes scabra]
MEHELYVCIQVSVPSIVLSLLSSPIIPYRSLHPSTFCLYLDLLNRHYFCYLSSTVSFPNYCTVVDFVDTALQLSKVYGTCSKSKDGHIEGVVIVRFVFMVMWQLMETSLEDEGLLEHKPMWWMNNNGGFGLLVVTVGDGGNGGSYFSEQKEGM